MRLTILFLLFSLQGHADDIASVNYTYNSRTICSQWIKSDSLRYYENSCDNESIFNFSGYNSSLSVNVTLDNPVTFRDFTVRPVFAGIESLPISLSANASFLFGFVKENETVGKVYFGEGTSSSISWSQLPFSVELNGNTSKEFLHISVRSDYTNGICDIYINEQCVALNKIMMSNTTSGFSTTVFLSDDSEYSQIKNFYVGSDNPSFVDSNSDGIPDEWLITHGLSGANAERNADPDGDGLSNISEFLTGTNPTNPDTDGDGKDDRKELFEFTDPNIAEFISPSLPFYEGFEAFDLGNIAFPQNYVLKNGLIGSVIASKKAFGNKSFEGTSPSGSSELKIFLQSPAQGEVWSDFYVRANSGNADYTPQYGNTSSSILYFTQNGVRAFNGNFSTAGNWVDSPLPQGGEWRRVTLRQNYAEKKWGLWIDGKGVFQNLGFANMVAFFQEMRVEESSKNSFGLDEININFLKPEGLDTDNDGIDDELEDTLKTNPSMFDGDGDGMSDFSEIMLGFDPLWSDKLYEKKYPWTCSFSQNEFFASGLLNGQNGWLSRHGNINEDEFVSLQTNQNEYADIEKLFGLGKLNSCWFGFNMKATPATLSEHPQEGLLVLAINQDGKLCVLNNNTWQLLDKSPIFSDQEYVRIDVHFDFISKKIRICANGVSLVSDLQFLRNEIMSFSRFFARVKAGESPSAIMLDDFSLSELEPAYMDFDGDGLLNSLEREIGSNPDNDDTDNDGISDGIAYSFMMNPSDATAKYADNDGDGLSNATEIEMGLNPNNADTDADGFSDSVELNLTTNPLDISDHPDSIGFADVESFNIGESKEDYTGIVHGKNFINTSNLEQDCMRLYGARVSGDFRVKVRWDSFVSSDQYQSFGLFCRNSESPTAPLFSIRIDNYNIGIVSERGREELKSSNVYDIAQSNGVWFMIERKGNVFIAYHSPDGKVWYIIQKSVIEAENSMLVGFGAIGLPPKNYRTKVFCDNFSIEVDSDCDGLFDDEEILLGTNIDNQDTDGDGISDYFEVKITKTNPNISNISAPIILSNGSCATAVSGERMKGDDYMELSGKDVWIEIPFNFVQKNAHLLQIYASFANSRSGYRVMRVYDSVNKLLAEIDIYGMSGPFFAILPEIPAGEHTLKFEFSGGEPLSIIRIGKISELSFDYSQWYNSYLESAISFASGNRSSRTSPAYFEWGQNAICDASISYTPLGETASINLNAVKIPDQKYYCDVPLQANGVTTIKMKLDSIEKNAAITWEKTDISISIDAPIVIRKGASLLVSTGTNYKLPQLAFKVFNGANQIFASECSENAVPIEFAESGTYSIKLYSADTELNTVFIDVVASELGNPPSVMRGSTREWQPLQLSPQAVLSTDTNMILNEIPSSNPRRFRISMQNGLNSLVCAKLEDGSVLDVASVNCVTNFDYLEKKLKVVETYPDGSKLWMITINMGGIIPPDFLAHVRTWKGGVITLDGSLELFITADMFDANGQYIFYLLAPADVEGSVCHKVDFYQGDYQIK